MKHLDTVTWSDDSLGFAEYPTLTGVAVDLRVTASTALLALLALELAALGQMGVLVVWVAGATFPQFGSVIGVRKFVTSTLTWSLENLNCFRRCSWTFQLKV